MKNFLLRLFISFLIGSIADNSCHSQENFSLPLEQEFYAGNSAYSQEKYTQAIHHYQHILEQGFESGNLYITLEMLSLKKET
jgi:hypothetical protein